MAGDRLTASEKRALLLWVAAAILGIVFAYKYFFQAFPEASVNLQVTREQAIERAQRFVGDLGESVTGYRSSAIFDVDDDAKVYLERQLGLKQANQLMSSELNLWFWDVRFFKPQQEEEFHVRLSPSGQVVGYDHKMEEKRAGASLEREAAQSAAQNYLRAKLGMDLSGWDVLPEEANSTKRPNRTDWSFTWEKHGFRAKDAPYRLEVTLLGDRIGNSQEFLKVPETWQRDYRRLRSGNDTLALSFYIPYILLLGAAVWLALRFTKEGKTRWRGAIWLGLLVVALLFLQSLNEWPHWAASYDTHDSYGTFLVGRVAAGLLLAVVLSLLVTLVLPSAEPLYRESQPSRMQLARAFTLRGLRSKEFFSAAVVGVSLAAAHIGYVVAFYLVAARLGAWAPQELNFDNSFNTAFPWISGAAIGLYASTNEEFTFRLFAIPFFNKLTRSRWIAVILPAFLWSFLHSNYPQEPAYTRGIEIGIVGIIAGLVMLRWGIVATLIWHYTVDASLVGLLLLRSNSLYFKISGAVVAAAALAPLAFACVSYLMRGGFEADEDLLNRSWRPPETAAAEPTTAPELKAGRRYDALSVGTLGFLAICLVVGALLAWRLKPESLGDYLKLSASARDVRARADQILRQRGLNPNSFYHATVLVDIADPVTNEFLRERIGIAGTNAIYAQRVPASLWRVRYFRDSQPEEFAVVLRPDGTLHSFRHTLAEATAGASLTKEEAVSRAEKFLSEEKKVTLSDWNLVESNSDKKPHRTDHTLTWEQKEPLDRGASDGTSASDQAHVRIELQLLGDEVTNYRTFIKIPDDWRRAHEERTLARVAVNYGIPTLTFVGLGLTALILFLKNLRSEAANSIPWKRITLWSLWALAGYLLAFALGSRLADSLNLYQTAIPLKAFLGTIGIGTLLGAVLWLGIAALLFALAWYYGRVAFSEERLPAWLGMPANYYRDALWIGLGGSAALLGLDRVLATISAHWPTTHRYLDMTLGQDFDAVLPAASILGRTALDALLFTGLVMAISSFVAARVRQPVLRIMLFLLGALALVGGGWGSPSDFAKQFAARLILLFVLIVGVSWVMRFNMLGCFLIAAGTSLFGGAAELLAQPNAFYRSNGYAVLIALVLLYAWPVATWRLQATNQTGGSSAPSVSV